MSGAFRPKSFDLCKPTDDLVTEAAAQEVIGHAELLIEAARTDERNSHGMTVDRPALPNQPEVQVKNPRGVSQFGDNFALHRNSVLVDFGVEGFAKRDDVLVILNPHFGIMVVGVEPKLHVIEEVEASPIDELVPGRMIFRPEKDCGREDAFEAVLDSPVMEAIGLKAEERKHLGGTLETDYSALLLERERRNPDGDEPVLPERKTVIRMAEDLEEKPAAVP